MSETLLSHPILPPAEKLHEKETAEGVFIVYKSPLFGHLLTHDQQVIVSEQDGFFYHEMMAHPALFTHPQPKKVAIIGHDTGIATEVLKHPTVQTLTLTTPSTGFPELCARYFPEFHVQDQRMIYQPGDIATWPHNNVNELFDIIILTQPANFALCYQRLLHTTGLLVLPLSITWPYQENWPAIQDHMQQAECKEWQLLHFPQPSHPTGWRFVIIASKAGYFKRIREKDVFNRNFITCYYNFDVHKAALALPE